VKILVIAMAGIGDALIATPLIHELRANFPTRRLMRSCGGPARGICSKIIRV